MTREELLQEIGPDEIEKLNTAKSYKNGHSERGHALLGGSSANVWARCPGSIFYTKEMPPLEPSEAMLQGTDAHEVAEILLEDFLQHKLEGIDPDIRVAAMNPDPEMLAGAEGYRDAVWHNLLEQSITDKAYGIETRVVLDEHLQMSGFVDFWCIYTDDHGKRVASICDYKYGYHHVSAETSVQLPFYACCLLAEIRRAGKDLDYVRTAIYQPRAPGKNPYEEVRFTAKQLDAWIKKFYKAAEQIFIKKKPIFKTGEWCQYCRARSECKVYGKELSAKTSLALIDPEVVQLPPVEKLSDEVLARIILNEDLIKDFLKAINAKGIERAKQGKPIKGIKAVLGGTRRKWKEDEGEVGTIITEYGVDPFTKKLRGITEIEKELSVEYGKPGAKQILESCCEQTIPSITLVSEADPRTPIQGSKDLFLNQPIGNTNE